MSTQLHVFFLMLTAVQGSRDPLFLNDVKIKRRQDDVTDCKRKGNNGNGCSKHFGKLEKQLKSQHKDVKDLKADLRLLRGGQNELQEDVETIRTVQQAADAKRETLLTGQRNLKKQICDVQHGQDEIGKEVLSVSSSQKVLLDGQKILLENQGVLLSGQETFRSVVRNMNSGQIRLLSGQDALNGTLRSLRSGQESLKELVLGFRDTQRAIHKSVRALEQSQTKVGQVQNSLTDISLKMNNESEFVFNTAGVFLVGQNELINTQRTLKLYLERCKELLNLLIVGQNGTEKTLKLITSSQEDLRDDLEQTGSEINLIKTHQGIIKNHTKDIKDGQVQLIQLLVNNQKSIKQCVGEVLTSREILQPLIQRTLDSLQQGFADTFEGQQRLDIQIKNNTKAILDNQYSVIKRQGDLEGLGGKILDEIGSLQCDLNDVKREQTTSKKDTDDLKRRLVSLQKALADVSSSIDTIKQDQEFLLHSHLDPIKTTMTKLERDQETLKSKVNIVIKNIDIVTQNQESILCNISKVEHSKESLQGDMYALKHSQEILENKMDALHSDLNSMEQIQQLTNSLVHGIRADMDNAKETLQELLNWMPSLQRSFGPLEQRLANLEQCLSIQCVKH